MKTNYTVAVYLIDLAYGGPEEGDWYYHVGEMIKPIKIFRDEEKAIGFAKRMDRLVARFMNKGRRPIHSVLSDGIYSVEVHEGVPPSHYPKVPPRYE